MRILALSNYYPPYNAGGEELSAQAIVNGLRKRGHEVEVITTNFGSSDNDDGVYRQFKLEMELKPLQNAIHFFTRRKSVIHGNEKVLESHVRRFAPDLILIFSLWNIPRQVPALAERLMNGRVVYRLASYWPALPSQYVYYWQTPAKSGLTWLPKAILSWPAKRVLKNDPMPALLLEHTVCISQAVYEEFLKYGIRLKNHHIIHNGIDIGSFFNKASAWLQGGPSGPLKLLYVGRISPEKGVHTALEALAMIQKEHPEIGLTVVGSSWGNISHLEINELAAQLNIGEKVAVKGHLSYEEVSSLMKSHDVLLVPSIWPEPFGRVVLEGMAAGMVVIGTAQGGMGVVLKENETGLVFPPENAQILSDQIERLIVDKELGGRLVKSAQAMVSSSFTEDGMVDAYEAYLAGLVDDGK